MERESWLSFAFAGEGSQRKPNAGLMHPTPFQRKRTELDESHGSESRRLDLVLNRERSHTVF